MKNTKNLINQLAEKESGLKRANKLQKFDKSCADKLALMKQAANDPLYLADLKEVNDDFSRIGL